MLYSHICICFWKGVWQAWFVSDITVTSIVCFWQKNHRKSKKMNKCAAKHLAPGVVSLKAPHTHWAVTLPTVGAALQGAVLHGTQPAQVTPLDEVGGLVIAYVIPAYSGAQWTSLNPSHAGSCCTPEDGAHQLPLESQELHGAPGLLVQLPGVVHAGVQQPGHHRPVPLLSAHSNPQMIVVLVKAVDPKHELVVLGDHMRLRDLDILLLCPGVPGGCPQRLVTKAGADQSHRSVVIPPRQYQGLVREDDCLVVAPGHLLEFIHRCERWLALDSVLSHSPSVLDVLLT